MSNTKYDNRFWGFTMIELLLGISIIGMLIALLFPAVSGALKAGKRTQARGDCKAVYDAINKYITEYGTLPVAAADIGSSDKYYGTGGGGALGDAGILQSDIINTLRAIPAGANANDALNKRRIAFLDMPSRKTALASNGSFIDPWGQVYYIKLDNNFDNQIDYFSTNNVRAVVVSYGANKTQQDPKSGDDLASSL